MKAHTQLGIESGLGPAPGATRTAPDASRPNEAWLSLLPRQLHAVSPKPTSEACGVGELAGSATDHESHWKRELAATSGASSGQLMAAAHAVAAYLVAGAQQVLQAAGEALTPTGASAVNIRLDYITPEGGHAAVELQHPDLGEVVLEVSLDGLALDVLAVTVSEHAAAAIREGRAALAQRLAAQGISLRALEVVVLRPDESDPEQPTARKHKRKDT